MAGHAICRKIPSVYDTHCLGPGLLQTTPVWSRLYCQWRRFVGEDERKDYPEPAGAKGAGPDSMAGLTVIVTGANSGIGQQAATIFAKRGANVVLVCRDPPPHEQHPNDVIDGILKKHAHVKRENLEWWKVDFTSFDDIKAFGEKWRSSGRVCDVLCNNAGSAMGPFIHTKDGFEFTHQVNFLAHCLVTLYVLPSMKKARAPRIVNTCSIFHHAGRLDFSNLNYEKRQKRGLGGVMAYCDTKLYLLMWTRELQIRLSRSQEYRHVIAHGIHPGFVASNIWNLPHIRALPRILIWLLDKLTSWKAIPPQQGSLAIVNAAVNPALGFSEKQLAKGTPFIGESAKIGGKFLMRLKESDHRPEVNDPIATARLWQRVLEDVKAAERGVADDLPGPAPGLL
ncbi:Dehydrogenases with different specificities (related to short-chain alcohol dehydrogenases) [Ceraceosorus bombacis]|uniref:Dehydrogenases with different specificities (Related to short-chain alcohol dehydrogenases) n=1 Tax=Ceraceosorus bombacis TaxID=401625 RepID=A0A0P1BN49_9BASI|nr:Dehydrogenases with different specificities (related to short-chain alcohol dehydrogenases) [Ceraceosorus bombacis]